MADKFTNRMGYNAIINGKVTDEVIKWAQGELAKLDAKNAKRKTAEGQIKEDNKPIADAILKALEGGSMLSTTLAKTIGQTPQKTNGVAGEMFKLGMIDKFKVKVKNKGEQTCYALLSTEAEGSGVEGE